MVPLRAMPDLLATLPVETRASVPVSEVMAPPILVPDSMRLDPLLALLRGNMR